MEIHRTASVRILLRLIRDTNTLEWIGAAPIFDSGSSLGYDKLVGAILAGRGIECKPFKRTHEEQLELVTSFNWLDFDKLYGLEDEMHTTFDRAGEYMEPARKDAICASVSHRIEHLTELAQEQRNQMDDQAQAVKKDAAADYGTKMNI